MASLPPAEGVARVTFTQSLSGRQFGDKLYFAHESRAPWTMSELESLAENAAINYAGLILPLQADNLTLVEVTALDLSDTGDRIGTSVSGAHGTSGGTSTLPLNSVAHLVFPPARYYRGGRPGYNVSGLDMTMLADDKSFSSAASTAIVTAFSEAISGIIAASGYDSPIAHVIVSYVLDKAIRAVPLVLDQTVMEMQQRICTLRRRLGKAILEIV
jgi:hypothetical protein